MTTETNTHNIKITRSPSAVNEFIEKTAGKLRDKGPEVLSLCFEGELKNGKFEFGGKLILKKKFIEELCRGDANFIQTSKNIYGFDPSHKNTLIVNKEGTDEIDIEKSSEKIVAIFQEGGITDLSLIAHSILFSAQTIQEVLNVTVAAISLTHMPLVTSGSQVNSANAEFSIMAGVPVMTIECQDGAIVISSRAQNALLNFEKAMQAKGEIKYSEATSVMESKVEKNYSFNVGKKEDGSIKITAKENYLLVSNYQGTIPLGEISTLAGDDGKLEIVSSFPEVVEQMDSSASASTSDASSDDENSSETHVEAEATTKTKSINLVYKDFISFLNEKNPLTKIYTFQKLNSTEEGKHHLAMGNEVPAIPSETPTEIEKASYTIAVAYHLYKNNYLRPDEFHNVFKSICDIEETNFNVKSNLIFAQLSHSSEGRDAIKSVLPSINVEARFKVLQYLIQIPKGREQLKEILGAKTDVPLVESGPENLALYLFRHDIFSKEDCQQLIQSGVIKERDVLGIMPYVKDYAAPAPIQKDTHWKDFYLSKQRAGNLSENKKLSPSTNSTNGTSTIDGNQVLDETKDTLKRTSDTMKTSWNIFKGIKSAWQNLKTSITQSIDSVVQSVSNIRLRG